MFGNWIISSKIIEHWVSEYVLSIWLINGYLEWEFIKEPLPDHSEEFKAL